MTRNVAQFITFLASWEWKKREENKNIHSNQACDVFINHDPRWIRERVQTVLSVWRRDVCSNEGQRLEIHEKLMPAADWFQIGL